MTYYHNNLTDYEGLILQPFRPDESRNATRFRIGSPLAAIVDLVNASNSLSAGEKHAVGADFRRNCKKEPLGQYSSSVQSQGNTYSFWPDRLRTQLD